MGYQNKYLVSLILSFLMGTVVPVLGNAQSIDNLTIVKMSPADGTAVIQHQNGKTALVRTGDIVQEKYRISEISGNRMVLRDMHSEIGEQIIFHVKDGKQTNEHISLRAPESENQYQNNMTTTRYPEE